MIEHFKFKLLYNQNAKANMRVKQSPNPQTNILHSFTTICFKFCFVCVCGGKNPKKSVFQCSWRSLTCIIRFFSSKAFGSATERIYSPFRETDIVKPPVVSAYPLPRHKRTYFQPGPINMGAGPHLPTPAFFNSNMNINKALMSNFPSFTGSSWK